MGTRNTLGIIGLLGLSVAFVQPAMASCSGNQCDLGGFLRFQVGRGLPNPITFAPGLSGPIVGNGHVGGVPAIAGAKITQQTVGVVGPRSLMLQPGRFFYDDAPASAPIFVPPDGMLLSVRTDLTFSYPHSANGVVTFAAGHRTGPPIVTWCAGNPLPTASFNPGCLNAGDLGSGTPPDTNGLVRYTATMNQFGGVMTGRRGGTAQRFFNVAGLTAADLPCPGGLGCVVGVSSGPPPATAVAGATFDRTTFRAGAFNPNGFFSASIGANGKILNLIAFLPGGGPFGNGAFPTSTVTTWGFPLTTGMLTISVTQNVGLPQVFVRTGMDARNGAGSGIVTLVGGSLSSRTLLGAAAASAPSLAAASTPVASGPNAERATVTLVVPEPDAAFAAIVALAALAALAIVHARFGGAGG